ncbi:MAG TPA: chemotaxis protein CheW [Pyrinomonadaceae bacterium]|nr:chemotaxis protein CheW [Pyrinomonadaceae bacterium]
MNGDDRETTTPTATTRDFVVVRLEDEYFAFDVADVAEVLPYTQPVRMPRAPKFIVGVVDVRGHLLPVVDLRLRAGLSGAAPPRRILAVRLGGRFVGASVDEVCEVYEADETRVLEVASLGERLDAQFVRRALRWGQRLVPVMDAARLLTTDETLKLKRIRTPRRRRGERTQT